LKSASDNQGWDFPSSWQSILLYIELTVSFLIGRKHTVNFRNQRMWRHNCRLYNNHVKVTGNHVVYDRNAWFLRVIMSSSLALFFLPSMKKQKHEIFCFVQCIIKQLLDSVFVISRIIIIINPKPVNNLFIFSKLSNEKKLTEKKNSCKRCCDRGQR